MPPLPSRLLTWLLFARPLFGGSVIGSFTCARAPPLKGRGIHFPHGAQKEGGGKAELNLASSHWRRSPKVGGRGRSKEWDGEEKRD